MCALGSITTNKSSGGDGIPVELFQILKDDAVKVLHSICQQIWKTQQWPLLGWKRSFFIPIPKKGNVKECSNYCSAQTWTARRSNQSILKEISLGCSLEVRESIPRYADKKSPQGDRSLEFSRRRKGQTFFPSIFLSLSHIKQLHSAHMLVKQCSKFSKPGFNNMWTMNFQIFKLVLEKAEEPDIKLPHLLNNGKSK